MRYNYYTEAEGIDIAKIADVITEDSAVETAPPMAASTTDVATDDQIDADELKTQDACKCKN